VFLCHSSVSVRPCGVGVSLSVRDDLLAIAMYSTLETTMDGLLNSGVDLGVAIGGGDGPASNKKYWGSQSYSR